MEQGLGLFRALQWKCPRGAGLSCPAHSCPLLVVSAPLWVSPAFFSLVRLSIPSAGFHHSERPRHFTCARHKGSLSSQLMPPHFLPKLKHLPLSSNFLGKRLWEAQRGPTRHLQDVQHSPT